MLIPLAVAIIALFMAGWILAFRARGKVIDLERSRSYWSDRAKLAEAKFDVQRQRAIDAETSRAEAEARQREMWAELGAVRYSLSKTAADRDAAVDELAKRPSATSDPMDSTISRLLQNRHRRIKTP